MEYTEFALKIKEKYPVYKDMDDLELAQKVVGKYPEQYSDVSFAKVQDKGLFQVGKEQFTQGLDQVDIAKLNTREAMGLATDAEKARLQYLEAKPMQGYDKSDIGLRALGVVASQAPVMGEFIKGGVIGGATGAVVGSAIPAVGTIAGLGWGSKVGAGIVSFEQEFGSARSEFKSLTDADGNKLPMEVVNGASFAVGSINTAFEMVGVTALAKTFPALKGISKEAFKNATITLMKDESKRALLEKIGKDYAKGVGTEILTEELQEFINVIAGEVAKNVSGQNFEKAKVSETLGRLAETGVDTLITAGLVSGVGSTARVATIMNKKGETNSIQKAEAMTTLQKKVYMEENHALLAEDIRATQKQNKENYMMPEAVRYVTPKAGETKALTYFADTVVSEISKKLGVKVTVTSRYRENKGYTSEHGLGIAGDVSMSEHTLANRLKIATELLNDPTVKFISTSDPEILKAFKGNTKVRDFRKIDANLGKKQGFNHINHLHVTVNETQDQNIQVASGDVVSNYSTEDVLAGVREKIASRRKEVLADIADAEPPEAILSKVDKMQESLETPEDVQRTETAKGYLVDLVNSSEWAKANNKKYTNANIMSFVNTEKFDKHIVQDKNIDAISHSPEMINDALLSGSISGDMNTSDILTTLKDMSSERKIVDDFKTTDKQFSYLKKSFQTATSIQQKDNVADAFFTWLEKAPPDLIDSYVADMNLSAYYDASKPYSLKLSNNNIKDTIKAFKKGFKEGVATTKKDIKDVQKALVDFLDKAEITKEDKAKFINKIKDVQTVEQLDKALPKIQKKINEIIENAERKELYSLVSKELKQKETTTVGGIKKGKFDVDTTKIVKELRNINKMTKEKAGLKLAELQLKPIENPTFVDKLILKMYAFKANGANSSSALLKSLLKDVRKLKKEGLDAKNEEELLAKIDKVKNLEEVVGAIDSHKGDMNKWQQAYFDNIGSFVSLSRELFGDKLAKKFNFVVNELGYDQGISSTTRNFNEKMVEILKKDGLDLHETIKQMTEAQDIYMLREIGGIRSRKLSIFEVMDIYNSIKNEDIKKDYFKFYGEEQILNLVGSLNEAQMQVADEMQTVVQSYYDTMNEYNIKHNGVELPMRANYWCATSEINQDNYNALNTYIPLSSIPSSLKNKVRGSKPIPVNCYDKMSRHIRQGEWIKNLAEVFHMINPIFSDKNFKQAMNEKFPNNDFSNIFRTTLEETSLQGKSHDVGSVFGKGVEQFIGTWSAAKIASIPVFLKQFISVSNYSLVTPNWGKDFMYGITNGKEVMDFMLKELPYINERFISGQDDAVSLALKSVEGASKYKQNMMQACTYLTRAGDLGSIVFGGYPYYKHLLTTMSKEEAQKAFILQTETTMQGKTSSNLSQLQKDSRFNFFMRFRNTSFQYSRMIFDSYFAYKRGDVQREQFQGIIGMYVVINSVLFSLAGSLFNELRKGITEAIKGDDDSDDEWADKKQDVKDMGVFFDALNQVLLSPINSVPLLSELMLYGLQKLEGQDTYDIFATQGLTEVKNELTGAVSSLNKGNIAGILYHTAVMTEGFHAVPIKNIIREVDPWTGGAIKEAVSNKKKKKVSEW